MKDRYGLSADGWQLIDDRRPGAVRVITPRHAAQAVLLGLNGLGVSEACGTNIGIWAWSADIGSPGSSARTTSRRSRLSIFVGP